MCSPLATPVPHHGAARAGCRAAMGGGGREEEEPAAPFPPRPRARLEPASGRALTLFFLVSEPDHGVEVMMMGKWAREKGGLFCVVATASGGAHTPPPAPIRPPDGDRNRNPSLTTTKP